MTISGCKLFSGGARIDENPAEENRKEQSIEQTATLIALIPSVDIKSAKLADTPDGRLSPANCAAIYCLPAARTL